jgi:hypothetical protein
MTKAAWKTRHTTILLSTDYASKYLDFYLFKDNVANRDYRFHMKRLIL